MLKLYFVFICILLTSCGSPRSYLNKIITDKNFIPFELPMETTRVGTLLKGNNQEMYVVARPERCFPDLPGDQNLRWIQNTNLPNEYKSIEMNFDVKANDVLSGGNNLIQLNLSAQYIKTIKIEFTGASIEFLDEWAFEDYWFDGMSSQCKLKLASFPFIVQALRVDKMNFQFYNKAGAQVDLSANISSVVNIGANVSWKVEKKYTLQIDTPKFIGYRLAQVSVDSDSPQLTYSTQVDNSGDWIFKEIIKQKALSFVGVHPAENLKSP